MTKIKETFHNFIVGLELTKKQRDDANRQHINLRTQLQQRMSVEANFISGSYARKTAVRLLNDIDVFLVLKPQRGLDPTIPTRTVLGEVKRVLEEIYPGKSALLQSRSVNIAFSGTGIAYDVVPAFTSRPDVYTVPDRETGRWIKTNPKIHAEMSTQANEHAGKKLKPLLKFLDQAGGPPGIWLPFRANLVTTQDALAVVARLQGIVRHYRVDHLHLFSAGPDYLVPLLTSMTQKVPRVDFYEHDRAATDLAGTYVVRRLD